MGQKENTQLLLVEDNPTDACLLENLLSEIPDSHFDVQHVSALSEAQNACRMSEPDIILLDLSLPDSYGLRTIRELKTVASNTPIIVMTGSLESDTIDKAVQAGAQDLLQKGEYNAKFLGKTIRYAIERKQSELELKQLAHFDPLTGIANRVLFIDNMTRALAHAKRHNELLSLMFIDLDNFKAINDTLGHEAGDNLLIQVSGRLNEVIRECDTVARLGGDEFAIIIEDISTVYNSDIIAEKILQKLSAPFLLNGQEMFISASIGIAIAPEAGDDLNTLLKHADIAMYRAKKEGKNTFQIYTESLDNQGLARIKIERDLKNALEHNEFELHYQPLFDVKTGKTHTVEALLRWRHPERKQLIPPTEFIPILEETGMIVPVGDWVLHTACEQCKHWQEEGLPNIHVAVNVSPRQLQEPDPVGWIANALKKTGLDGKYLNIEITEDILIDNPEQAKANIQRMRDMDIDVSIDDFGTGYSSLSYLMNFELDVLKIDRSFLNTLSSNPATPVILKAIIEMAHGLGLQVVAEGVEQSAQYELLKALGCDVLQGYLFSRPLDAQALFEYLDEKYAVRQMKAG